MLPREMLVFAVALILLRRRTGSQRYANQQDVYVSYESERILICSSQPASHWAYELINVS